jgi:hypothetical protein
MTPAAVAAAVEHIEKTHEIGVRVSVRIDKRMSHAWLRGEMRRKGWFR